MVLVGFCGKMAFPSTLRMLLEAISGRSDAKETKGRDRKKKSNYVKSIACTTSGVSTLPGHMVRYHHHFHQYNVNQRGPSRLIGPNRPSFLDRFRDRKPREKCPIATSGASLGMAKLDTRRKDHAISLE